MAEITVLLATYNGADYIRQQVDSILQQTCQDFHLILSDDGSKDNTPELLEYYAQKHPDRITHYRSGQRFGCAQFHFMHLLSAFHDTPYIMFCDQDDVWHKDKIERTLAKMKQVETDPSLPTLVHTDLLVVDDILQPIAPSFCQLSHLDGSRMALNQVVVQNVVTGCTAMMNRALAQLAARTPDREPMLMHDWWLAILATAAGNVGFLNEPTISYRQHGNNSVGAKDTRSFSYLWDRFSSRDTRKVMIGTAEQVKHFLKYYADILQPEQLAMLQAFAQTVTDPWLIRVRTYMKYRIFKYGFFRRLAQLTGG